ncbi:protein CREG1-like [Sitodiplosis mosellana]|uniref:protein CREG1-like n=1 Tax=Sitodiplosis mosellana TaxID=263140 RepID=UPI002443EDF3|nr:protein CREG1-like [Sitodiplosis mosellana]
MVSSRVAFGLMLFGILSFSEYRPATGLIVPPPYRDYGKIPHYVARYLVHKSNWTSMGTISSQSFFQGFPMVNVISIADSANNGPSTGHIYFLLTDLDFTGQDLAIDNKLTAMFTEDQDLACTSKNIDTMEPTCARAIFTGKVVRLIPGTDEHKQAAEWYTDRHPASIKWQSTHEFYFCKLDIEQIAVLDYYGGVNYVSVDDYYNAN